MTFFLILAGLKAVETVTRGYRPPITLAFAPPKTTSTQLVTCGEDTRAHERGTYGEDTSAHERGTYGENTSVP